MRIPRKIRLHNTSIKVLQVKSVRASAERAGVEVSGTEDLDGLADIPGGRIFLNRALAPEVRAHVLRHEVAHFVAWLLGLRLTEAQVDALAAVLADVRRDL